MNLDVGISILVLEVVAEATLLTFQYRVWKRITAAELTAEARYQSIISRYDTVKAEARAEAEARIAQARAEIEAANADLASRAAQLEAQAAEAMRSAEMARRGAIGNEAREAKGMAAAEMEARVAATIGEDVLNLVKEQFPGVWARACQFPGIADRILSPVVTVINGGKAAVPGARRSVGGWVDP